MFNFHTFVNFLNFLLLLICNFILLWSDNMLSMISVLLNLLRRKLLLRSVLENVPCILEKNIGSVGGGLSYSCL